MLIVAVVGFALAEVLTFYAYSPLWLAEGQPGRHGDPTLNLLAWIALGAMATELVAFVYVVARIYRRVP